MTAERILIAGGAGFIGSRLAAELVADGRKVTVIDGLMPQTGADRRHLEPVLDRIAFVDRRIEQVDNLAELVAGSNCVIDCMGWSFHRRAMENPAYDAELNLASHLALLQALRAGYRGLLVYLGSRGQYGKPAVAPITETSPQEPVDMQGIHKVAAESYYRLFARRLGADAVSLRFAACVGVGQPVAGDDIGLFGGFARELLQGGTLSIYGTGRGRTVMGVGDLAAIARKVIDSPRQGFEAYNVPGHNVAMEDAARMIRNLAGSGEIRSEAMPAEIAGIDIGEAEVDCSKLRSLIGDFALAPLEETLRVMVEYFREELR